MTCDSAKVFAERLLRYGLLVALAFTLPIGHPVSAESPSGSARLGRPPAIPIADPPERSEPGAGPLRLILPPILHALVGHEANIYFDNVVLALRPENYAFDVICAQGRQEAERWTWVPTAADVGTHPWILEVRDEQNRLIARSAMTVQVLAADAATGREATVLMVGDSLTHASIYPAHVLARSREAGGPKLTLVGSHVPNEMQGDVRHEGYGGWTAQRFATHFTPTARQGDYRQRGSPFLYEQPDGTRRLDFQRYVADVCQGRPPDIVTIFLGPNDVYSQQDATIDATVETMLKHLDELIAAVQAGAPAAHIGILLPVPPAASQDAFGANYGSSQTRWQYKRNQHRVVERMIEHYGQRKPSARWLVPTVVNLDCARNYPATEVLANAQAETGQKIHRLSNGVHPAASGYRQMGDTLYAWIVAQLTDSANK